MRTRVAVILLCLIGVLALLHPPNNVYAASITINTITDDNAGNSSCSLREAITAANNDAAHQGCSAGSGTDTISFDAMVFATPQIINLMSALPDIASDMTIDGIATPDRITVRHDTGGARIFNVTSGVIATIDALTLTNGSTSANGGGILNNGTLTVTDSIISGNTSGNFGGGIYNDGTLTVTGSTLSDNATSGSFGGGIYNDGTLTVTDSIISGNSANIGGGGIFNSSGTATVINSVLSSNLVLAFGGSIYNDGTLTLINSTLNGNSAGSGGGIRNDGTLTLNNSIIANSPSGDECVTVSGTLNASHSVIEDELTCVNGTNLNNRTGDPNLDMTTLIPNSGSNATNTGSNILAVDADNNPLTTDLAGNARVQVGIVDAGAYEGAAYTPDFIVDRSDDVNAAACSTAANDCTLRGAITLANTLAGTDTISFDAAVFATPQTINLMSALPDIASDMTIDGIATPDRITVRHDTGGARIFNVTSGVIATIDALTLTNGITSGSGGGILNNGTLTVTDSVISGNTSGNFGGGIYNDGTLTVTGSTLSGNTTSGMFGGGIYNDGTLTVTDTTLSGNSANIGGGGIYSSGTLTVMGSTLNDNIVLAFGGGIYNASGTATVTNSTLNENITGSAGSGGGIRNDDTLTVTNSTLSGNSADSGGGIRNNGTLMLNNSTITGNTASSQPTHAGIWIETGATTTLNNTLLADNGVGNCAIDGTLNAGSDSMSDDATCTGATVVADVTLELPALADNGGDVMTHALVVGSPAINAGNNALIADDLADLDGDLDTSEDIPFDGRGNGFPRIIDTTVDIGAYEASVASGVILVDASPNPMQEGGTATYSIVLNAPPNAGETVRIQPRGFNSRFITVSPSQVQFTDANWDIPQIITITAPDDPLNRGVRYQTLIQHLLTTNGSAYAGMTVDRLRIVISDNDLSDDQDQAYYDALNLAAWLEVSPGAIPAGTASVGATVRLNGQPMPGEVVVVNMYVGAGVTVSPSQLVFTEHNWDIPQPVTLIASAEGSTALQVVVDANSTTSPEFVGAAQAVSVTVLPTGSSVTPAEQPAAPFVPAPEASAETNEGSVSE